MAEYDIDVDEFEGYLKINEYQLEEDIVQQPSLYFAVGRALARADSMRDELYRKAKETEAELGEDIREEMLEAGNKATEAAVKNAVLAHKDAKKAHKAFEQARAKASELGKLEAAFAQRSYMIRDLVSMQVASMHTNASVTGGSRVEKEIRHKSNVKEMSKGRRRLDRKKE